MRVPWTERRSNHSILKEISPECPLEKLMMKMKLQYFIHLMGRANLFEKTLMLAKIEGKMVGWHHQLDGHEFKQAPGVGDRKGSLACFSPWDGVAKSCTRLNE